MECFKISDSIIINVDEKYSLDLPKAFTPNSDNKNEKIYVKGWGIKKLIEFKIYNKTGQLVYQSNDINQGWDGKFNGTILPADIYLYYIVVKTYNNKLKSKNGYIYLLR